MLEYAVRPYQTPNSQGKVKIPATRGTTTARATITWGAKNSSIPSPATTVNVQCCSDQLDELQREGETVRITQPDNPDNYVDVFRSKKLTLNKKSADNCQTPLDQYLGAEFGLGATGDENIDLGFAGDVPDSTNCGQTWNLNNNTAAAA